MLAFFAQKSVILAKKFVCFFSSSFGWCLHQSCIVCVTTSKVFKKEIQQYLVTLVRILKRGITLIHPYSRNKSDKDLFIFSCCVWNGIKRRIIVKTEMAWVFNTSPNFIHCFELIKLACNQKKIKLGLHSQTYSWIKVIPLPRIRTIVSKVCSSLDYKMYMFKVKIALNGHKS